MDANCVRCQLCPHRCMLEDGKTGICRVRTNRNGILWSDSYGRISSIHSDPVEKKPLYHFFPGRSILSVGSVGCNLHCRFCQNCEISQVSPENATFLRVCSPADLVILACREEDNLGIAFTYNEPVIWSEFVLDVAMETRKHGKKNVLVTNGYINTLPLEELLEWTDAFSVDLKAFDDSFYRKITSSSLKPVLSTLQKIRASGKHLEIVNLLIPGLNDDPVRFEEMVKWIRDELGRETVLHLSAYYPRYLATEPPTPSSTLLVLSDIAHKFLEYIYTGNLPGEENTTICPGCKSRLVVRKGYHVFFQNTIKDGCCAVCGKLVFLNF